MHFDYGSLLKTCSAISSSEIGIGFKLMSFAVLSVQHEQSQRSDGLPVTSSLPNSKLCGGVDLSVLLDMPAVVARDHRGLVCFACHASRCC